MMAENMVELETEEWANIHLLETNGDGKAGGVGMIGGAKNRVRYDNACHNI